MTTPPKNNWTLKLNLRELLDAHTKIVAELEEQGHREIEVDADYYWSIVRERLYDVHARPSEDDFTIGQLSEDYEFLFKDPSQETAVTTSLKWLGTLLCAYAHQVEANAGRKR